MVRRPAHKEDFLTAIQYELHLDLLRKRRKKVCVVCIIWRLLTLVNGFQRLRVSGVRQDADYGIGNRIHGLFRVCVRVLTYVGVA